jgi:hypothetical protein
VTECHIPEDFDSSGTLHCSVPADFNIPTRAKVITALLKESSHLQHLNKVSAMSNMESKISLRNNARDLADAGPRICYAVMIQ